MTLKSVKILFSNHAGSKSTTVLNRVSNWVLAAPVMNYNLFIELIRSWNFDSKAFFQVGNNWTVPFSEPRTWLTFSINRLICPSHKLWKICKRKIIENHKNNLIRHFIILTDFPESQKITKNIPKVVLMKPLWKPNLESFITRLNSEIY